MVWFLIIGGATPNVFNNLWDQYNKLCQYKDFSYLFLVSRRISIAISADWNSNSTALSKYIGNFPLYHQRWQQYLLPKSIRIIINQTIANIVRETYCLTVESICGTLRYNWREMYNYSAFFPSPPLCAAFRILMMIISHWQWTAENSLCRYQCVKSVSSSSIPPHNLRCSKLEESFIN